MRGFQKYRFEAGFEKNIAFLLSVCESKNVLKTMYVDALKTMYVNVFKTIYKI